jgi:hypothetical protein
MISGWRKRNAKIVAAFILGAVFDINLKLELFGTVSRRAEPTLILNMRRPPIHVCILPLNLLLLLP